MFLHGVVLPLLYEVPPHDLDLVEVVVRLPVDEVHLAEELLLVVLELADHLGRDTLLPAKATG